MRFDPELFAQGSRDYLQQKNQNTMRAQAALDAGYQADDTGAIENSRRTLEGKGGLLGRLFNPEERSHGLENPYVEVKPGGDEYAMRVADMKGLNGQDVYSRLESGFKKEIGSSQSNEDIARSFNKYQSAVEKADRYFKNDNAKGLDVRQYLRYGTGGGGAEKLEKLAIYDQDGSYVDMVTAPASALSDSTKLRGHLEGSFPDVTTKAGEGYTIQPLSADAPRRMSPQAIEDDLAAGRKEAQDILNKRFLWGDPDEEEIAIVRKYLNKDYDGKKWVALRSQRTQSNRGTEVKGYGKQPDIWIKK